MPSAYAGYLAAAVAYADRLTAISDGSAAEFSGYDRMLRAAGTQGPEVRGIDLPVLAPSSTETDLQAARELLTFIGLPLVLVVGSHEPRKNHLAVLHAAEGLWREGHDFSLGFIGTGSWNAEPFYARVSELQAAGRPVESVKGLSDRLLWAAYRLAHCVVFPSLNEGFGLPVAESLAAGTPVITSNYGSMREIVAPAGVPLGGLLVDPRSDESIADAIRSMLTDTELHARLTAEAAAREAGTWDDYARQTWTFLVDRTPPSIS